jgi:hypothetical protein
MVTHDRLAIWVAKHPFVARLITAAFGVVTVWAAGWLAGQGFIGGEIPDALRSVFGL